MRSIFVAGLLLASSAIAVAQPAAAPAPNAQGDLAVTIYNNDRALIEDKRTLNLPAGRSRQEFDYAIPAADARALLALCVGGMVDKRRHLVRHGEHLWEIDEFLGDNAGLVVAEIELGAADEAFERPAWLGVEVTELPRYYNLALASRPYSQWSEDERGAADA